MSHSAEFLSEVDTILRGVADQITYLENIKRNTADIGNALLALRTHNTDAMNAAGALVNFLPMDLDKLIAQFRVTELSLQHYRSDI